MIIELKAMIEIEDGALETIQKLTHHVDWLMDLDSWPEIKSVSGVTVKTEG